MINELENNLRRIIGNQKIFSKIAVVDFIDKDKLECTVFLEEDEDSIFFNVKLSPNKDGGFITYPKMGSTVIISFLDDYTCYISQMSEIEGYYISNSENSFLDLMNDLFTAIKNIQLTHPYGPTTPQGVINQPQFDALQDKFKNLFLK